MKAKVLIVDDAPNIRMLLEYNLKKEFDLTILEDGAEAKKWLSEGNTVDILVTDIMMPNVDGYELVEFIRKETEMKNLPVIMLSAKGQSTDKIKGLQTGADDYLTKPFNPEELVIRINNLLTKAGK